MQDFIHSIFDFETRLIANLRAWCEKIAESCRSRGKPVAIELVILQSLQFDAYAKIGQAQPAPGGTLAGGTYQVFLTRGFIIRLAFIFELYTNIWAHLAARDLLQIAPMLSLPPEDPQLPLLIHSAQLADFREMMAELFLGDVSNDIAPALDRLNSLAEPSFFRKPAKQATKTLLESAIFFIVTHECMHIERGHLDYLKGGAGLAALPEFIPHGFPMDFALHRQMEIDADSQAFLSLFRALLLRPACSQELATNTLDVEGIFGFYLALATLFSVFDQLPRAVDRYSKTTHPDPAVRFHDAHVWTLIGITEMLPDHRDRAAPLRAMMESALPRSFGAILLADKALGLPSEAASMYYDNGTGQRFAAFQPVSMELLQGRLEAQAKWVNRARPAFPVPGSNP